MIDYDESEEEWWLYSSTWILLVPQSGSPELPFHPGSRYEHENELRKRSPVD